MRSNPLVDVVVVSYNSRAHLRSCVWSLVDEDDAHVVVVDNASTDGSLDTVSGLDVVTIPLPDNRGFAHGCNVGTAAGQAPYVLLLNPDASIDGTALRQLVGTLALAPAAGAVAPKITEPDGTLDYSLRRFPRLVSAFAQALFLQRLFPRATWSDAVVRDESVYGRPGKADWVSGACILLRRSALEQLAGLDEGFFLYSEDVDLCRRLWDAGYEVRYEPDAICVHAGGQSAPRAELLPVLAQSRIRYAQKHQTRVGAATMRLAVALGAATHVVICRGGIAQRRGHALALRAALSHTPERAGSGFSARSSTDAARAA